jgi:predicted aspartyl protease
VRETWAHEARVPEQGPGKRAAVVGGCVGRPIIKLSLNGRPVTALVDTGASCTLLRRRTYLDIIQRNHRPSLLTPGTPLQAVNSGYLDVVGNTEIHVEGISTPLTMTVVDNLPHEMILGDTSLRLGKGIIDLSQNEIKWFGRVWPLNAQNCMSVASLGQILPATGDKDFDTLVRRNAAVFSAKNEPNGQCKLVQLRIETNGPPPCQKAYRAPLRKRRLIEEALD